MPNEYGLLELLEDEFEDDAEVVIRDFIDLSAVVGDDRIRHAQPEEY